VDLLTVVHICEELEKMSINEMMRGYDYYKQKYEQIKPIRGRSIECKPLGKRSRDWETVVKTVQQDASEIYSAKLYDTECVRYHANGDIELRCGTYATPITADFIWTHSPFPCKKQYNKLWITVRGNGDVKDRTYPIDEKEGLILKYTAGGVTGGYKYEPKTPVIIQQEVVDRAKAKDARKPVKPFLDWVKMMSRLSDGWIMNETREQFAKFKLDNWRVKWDYELPTDVVDINYWGGIDWKAGAYKFISECDPEQYMKLYLAICNDTNKCKERKIAKSVPNPQQQNHNIDFHDMQFDFEYVKRNVYKMVDSAVDTKKVVEIEVGDKPVTNVK